MSDNIQVIGNAQITPTDNQQYELSRVTIQHYVLLSLLFILLIVSIFHFAKSYLYIDKQLDISPKDQVNLPSKINPNTASWEILSLLPGIGPSKAMAIIQYREELITKHHNSNDISIEIYHSSSDLNNVSGIGPATIQNIQDYLFFE